MLLTEASMFTDYEIVESAIVEGGQTRKGLTIRGKFGQADFKNDNGRIYPKAVWEGVLRDASYRGKLESRNVFGELDHPDDGRTLLSRASHIVTELSMRPDGVIIGEAEILPTPNGKILEALFRAGTKVGISSRGEGDLIKNESGDDVVQPGYKLQTFDFVHNPSTSGAYPRPMESVERGNKPMSKTMDTYSRLEKEVLGLSRLNLESIGNAKPVIESRATELLSEISQLIESGDSLSPLYSGLLTDLQSTRRKLSEETVTLGGPPPTAPGTPENNVPPKAHFARLKKATKNDQSAQATEGEAGNVEQLPAVTQPNAVELIPGSEKFHKLVGEMEDKEEEAMAEAKRDAAIRALVKEAEGDLSKIRLEGRKSNAQRIASAVASRVEGRLLSKARGVLAEMGDPVPSPYEPVTPDNEEVKESRRRRRVREQDDMDYDDEAPMEDPMEMDYDDEEMSMESDYDGDDDLDMGDEPMEMKYEMDGDDDLVDVPEPPEEMYAEEDDEEEEDMPPMESKLRRAWKKVIKENARLRYQIAVTEAVAAKSIGKLARKVRITEANCASSRPSRAPRFVRANGKRIPTRLAGEVIESLVTRYKALSESNMINESTEDFDPGNQFSVSTANVGRLNENLNQSTGSKKPGLMESQAILAKSVAKRIGRN